MGRALGLHGLGKDKARAVLFAVQPALQFLCFALQIDNMFKHALGAPRLLPHARFWG